MAAIIQHAEKKQSSNIEGNMSGPMGHSTLLEVQRFSRLPPRELPKFDGRLEEWLSFKINFRNEMTRLEVDSITSFHYLKHALSGSAANKIDILVPDESSYEEAWKMLTAAYERTRILAATHLDAIFAYPVMSKVSSTSLADMLDTVRQHMTRLKSPKIVPHDYSVIRALERALPINVRAKRKKTLTVDTLPSLDSFYRFLQTTSNCMQTMEMEEAKTTTAVKRRTGQQSEKGNKFRRSGEQARVLATTSTLACYYCEGEHTIYRCPGFLKLSVQQRWDATRTKKLCRMCLRPHEGKCEERKCKKCDKAHHFLLHSDPKANSAAQKP